MAFISIEGEITRSFFQDKGFEVTETYNTKDGERKNRYTLWFNEPQQLQVGDTGVFSGTLSTKIDSYTNKDGEQKQVVVVSVNNAKWKVAAKSAPVAAPAPARDIDQDDFIKYGSMPF